MRHVKIPRGWSGDEALTVVSFLEDVIRAVWREHGKKMSQELCRVELEPWLESPAPDTDPADDAPPF
jgi:hypothetical protein